MKSNSQNPKQQMRRNKISRGATKVLKIFPKGIHNTERGITLVALIITVIVLLILAMVSISLVMNGGIIDKAEKGTESYSAEEELEQIKLAVASAKLAGNGFLTAENLNTELQKVFNNEEIVSENNSFYNYKTDKIYKIYKDGRIEEQNSEIPKEYQKIEYIESTGTQYITLSSFPTKDTELTIKGKAIAQNINQRTLWGIWDNNGTTIGFQAPVSYFQELLNKVKIYYANSWDGVSDNDKDILNENYVIEIKNGVQKYNGETLSNTIISNYTFSNSARNYGFPIIGAAYLSWEGFIKNHQIISEIIWKDDTQGSHHFIPCYSTTTVTDANGTQKPANTKGLYDTVDGKFYTNQGGGADFTAGPNV